MKPVPMIIGVFACILLMFFGPIFYKYGPPHKQSITKDIAITVPPTHTTMPPGYTLVVSDEGEHAARRDNGLIVECFDRSPKRTKQDAIDRAWIQYRYEGGGWKVVDEPKKETEPEGVKSVTMPDLSGAAINGSLVFTDEKPWEMTLIVSGCPTDSKGATQRPDKPEVCKVSLWTKDGTEWVAKWEAKK